MYKLISATPSPYARKVRIALHEKDIPFELITEVPWNSDTTTPQFNPLEKLPVLICGDGTTVYESRFVLEWLEAKHPTPPLAPQGIDDVLAMKRFEVIADGVCDAMVLMFLEKSREHPSAEWMARQSRKVDGGIRELARLLADRAHCVANRLTYADIAVGSLLGYARVRWPDNDWATRHPNLAALWQRLEQRPSFTATVPYAQTIRDKVA
jgi:glutathione S-transferase